MGAKTLSMTHMEKENEAIRIGGHMVECEADEIAFRCKAQKRRGQWELQWLRYFGLARRGSSKMYLALMTF